MPIRKQHIPWMMAAGRALLGPVLIAGVRCNWNGVVLASLIVAALVSDIFDGVLARRWGCDTEGVRLFDSMADTFFYVCVAGALWIGQPVLWAAWQASILLLVGLEAARIGLDFAKFGKPASYHSYLAKTWGLSLAATVVAAFGTGKPSTLLAIAVGLGVACNVEGMVMSTILPEWRRDVKTIAVAWRLRQELQQAREPKRGVAIKALTAMMVMLVALPTFALEAGEAKYVGGTVGVIERGVEGKLDLTDAQALIFLPAKGARLAIPYDRIKEYKQRDENTHRLPALLAVGVALLGVREHTYTVVVSYRDAGDILQLVTLEVPRADVKVVGNVMRERAPAGSFRAQ